MKKLYLSTSVIELRFVNGILFLTIQPSWGSGTTIMVIISPTGIIDLQKTLISDTEELTFNSSGVASKFINHILIEVNTDDKKKISATIIELIRG